jgi:addiction module RelE/StbE family toxin
VKVVFTASAQADLQGIRAYIGEHSPNAASRLTARIVAACDTLERFPSRGRLGRIPGTREIVAVWPYVIVYQIADSTVEILRIWHGAQDRRV